MEGDSGDLDNFEYIDSKGDPIKIPDNIFTELNIDFNGLKTVPDITLDKIVEDLVYGNVEFYENSIDDYNGESGDVTIRINDESLHYMKEGYSMYNRTDNIETELDFNSEEKDFIDGYINDFGVIEYENGFVVEYNSDFILTDKMELLLESIKDKLVLAMNKVYNDYNIDDHDVTNVELSRIKVKQMPDIFDVELYVTYNDIL